jgi:hypothetical protein
VVQRVRRVVMMLEERIFGCFCHIFVERGLLLRSGRWSEEKECGLVCARAATRHFVKPPTGVLEKVLKTPASCDATPDSIHKITEIVKYESSSYRKSRCFSAFVSCLNSVSLSPTK